MKKQIYSELMQYFDNLDHYDKEIDAMETTLLQLKFEESILDDILFWNHYLSLIDRIYSNTQNNLDFESTDEISSQSIAMAKTLIAHHPILNNYHITDFETYLLAIYFTRLGKEV